MLDQLKEASAFRAGIFFFFAQLAIFAASMAFSCSLFRIFRENQIFQQSEPLRIIELVSALTTVVLNSVISFLGWLLWTKGFITLKPASFAGGLLDCGAMLLCMDFGIYVFHRLAHRVRFFWRFHRFHHRHESTNPISLFVLHPAEVAGFGVLILAFLVIYPMTIGGLLAYLALNVACGTLAHSGVEPCPEGLRALPVFRWIATSTFHARHHENPDCNFGFYTLIWDLMFGSLDPHHKRR